MWRRLALPMAVVVAGGHMTKALAKFASWSVFLPHAVSDERSIRTAAAISSHALGKPEALLPLPAISVIGILVLVAGLGYAIRETRLAHEAGEPRLGREADSGGGRVPAALWRERQRATAVGKRAPGRFRHLLPPLSLAALFLILLLGWIFAPA
jgi:hypothetical protein